MQKLHCCGIQNNFLLIRMNGQIGMQARIRPECSLNFHTQCQTHSLYVHFIVNKHENVLVNWVMKLTMHQTCSGTNHKMVGQA